MADQAGTRLGQFYEAMAVARNIRNFFRPTHLTSAGRFRIDLGQQLSRFGPHGSDMTCQEHRIRELVTVGLAGRVTMEWAGSARVHSDQPYHSRSDANAGLVVGW